MQLTISNYQGFELKSVVHYRLYIQDRLKLLSSLHRVSANAVQHVSFKPDDMVKKTELTVLYCLWCMVQGLTVLITRYSAYVPVLTRPVFLQVFEISNVSPRRDSAGTFLIWKLTFSQYFDLLTSENLES